MFEHNNFTTTRFPLMDLLSKVRNWSVSPALCIGRLLQIENEYKTRYIEPKNGIVFFLAQNNLFHTQSQFGGVVLSIT